MYDNDEPEDREKLIQALLLKGLDASEYNSGGETMHVLVPLLDTYSSPPVINVEKPAVAKQVEAFIKSSVESPTLYLVTGSAASNCDIGFIGDDGRGGQVEFASWEHADTLDEAVNVFLKMWKQRDTYLQALVKGELSRIL